MSKPGGLTKQHKKTVADVIWVVVSELSKAACYLLVILLLIQLIQKVDSTDYSWYRRSNLRLHVDSEYGCHYLSTRGGGVTPRLDAEGEHVCTGREP